MHKPGGITKTYFYLKKVACPVVLIPVIAVTCFVKTGSAQPSRLNRLFEKLRTAKHDTDRVNVYYSLSRYYWDRNTDSALLMAQQSLELAQKIHFDKGIALAYLTKGVALGSKGMLPEALECNFNCLRIAEKTGMDGLAGNTYTNIGNIYAGMEDYTKALYYYQLAYKTALKFNDPKKYGIFASLVNVGEVFKHKGQPDSSIAYNLRAADIARWAKDSFGIATALYNVSENYVTKKNYKGAIQYLHEALAIAKKAGDAEDAAYCHSELALAYYYTKKYNLSLLFAKKALAENKTLGINDVAITIYNALYLTLQKTGNYRQALNYRNREVALRDSLNAASKEKAVRNIQFTYDLEKKQEQINLLNKDSIIKQQEIDSVTLKRNIITAGAALLLLLAFILFKNYLSTKRLSAQLEEQNKNMLAQNQRLGQLVQVRNKLFSIIAHDLRAPVHSVRDMMEIVREKLLTEEETALFIGKACENLLLTGQLLDNILYWAKSQMDGMQLSAAYFDVEKTIDQNVDLIKARADKKNVTIQKLAIEGGTVIYADAAMIDIVIRNLLQNALKFSKPGGAITIAAEKKDGMAVISVADAGVGISPENQHKIFDKFSPYTTYGTAREKGSGLGLLLCRELVEKNNGAIWFTSTPGQGSTFYFTVPRHKPGN